jgi:AcrR family transcriptional regulator
MTGVLDVTAQRCDTTDLVHDRILDAAEELICTRGIAGFTLDGVAQEAGVSKGGLLYHFRSKGSLISGLQRRMASRMADTLRAAKARSEPVLLAFVRHLRRDYERGGRSFAPLLLPRARRARGRNLARNCKPSWLVLLGKAAVIARERRCSCWQP